MCHWWCTPVIPALGRLKHEYSCEFKASLNDIERSYFQKKRHPRGFQGMFFLLWGNVRLGFYLVLQKKFLLKKWPASPPLNYIGKIAFPGASLFRKWGHSAVTVSWVSYWERVTPVPEPSRSVSSTQGCAWVRWLCLPATQETTRVSSGQPDEWRIPKHFTLWGFYFLRNTLDSSFAQIII